MGIGCRQTLLVCFEHVFISSCRSSSNIVTADTVCIMTIALVSVWCAEYVQHFSSAVPGSPVSLQLVY